MEAVESQAIAKHIEKIMTSKLYEKFLTRGVSEPDDWVAKVKAFNEAMDNPLDHWQFTPQVELIDKISLRLDMLREELMETESAAEVITMGLDTKPENTMKEYLDGLVDLIYIAIGGALELRLDIRKAFDIIHASNMSKLGPDGKPERRWDGKVLHGPNYVKPDLSECV